MGIFLVRHKLTISEFFIGSGPFILSNHYGEIDVFNKRVWTELDLLPHSISAINTIVFAFLGVIILSLYIVISLRKIKM